MTGRERDAVTPGGRLPGPAPQQAAAQGSAGAAAQDDASVVPDHGGAHAVAAARRHGVQTMFTLSGGHVFPLYDGGVKADPPMRMVDKIKIPEGYQIDQHMAALPSDPGRYSMKWDGEWHITYEVFRDLGIAFAAVLILIYGLVVGWFQSFLTPLIIMAAIPFSLVGILPAHGLLHAFFTATSMIGFIAGAGIVVRNSIILVDFIELRLAEGMPLDAAVIDAGAVRFRPMMLTAAAVVVGSSVILFDPIFQGLAIALMAGEIASLLLSRMTVPVVYYLFN